MGRGSGTGEWRVSQPAVTLRIFTNPMGSRHGFVTKDQCLVGSGAPPDPWQESPLAAGW